VSSLQVPSGPLGKTAAWWWQGLPDRARSVSLTLAVVLGDGSYFRAWPAVGAVVPPAAMLVGFGLGALHPGPVFSVSVVVLIILTVISALGAGPGAWTWLGFVVGDLLFADRSALPPTNLAVRVLALVLEYLILWGLLVVGPLLAVSARRLQLGLPARWRDSIGRWAGPVLLVLVQAAYTFGWAHASAFMLRPLWSYAGSTPDIDDIRPLQVSAPWLGLIAGVVAGGRLWLEHRAHRQSTPAPPPLRPPRKPWPLPVRVVAQVLLLSLLLSGLVGTVLEGLALLLAVVLIVLTRLVVVPRLPRYLHLVNRIPRLVRIAVCLAVGFLLAQLIVVPAAASGEQSFATMLGVVLASLLLAAFLLPGAAVLHADSPVPSPPQDQP
jgi:hypothetical protein